MISWNALTSSISGFTMGRAIRRKQPNFATGSSSTLGAVWSDLFALFAGTALEAYAEDLAWGVVNLFHRAASRKSCQLDRASEEIRASLIGRWLGGSFVQSGEADCANAVCRGKHAGFRAHARGVSLALPRLNGGLVEAGFGFPRELLEEPHHYGDQPARLHSC